MNIYFIFFKLNRIIKWKDKMLLKNARTQRAHQCKKDTNYGKQ